MIKAVDGTIEDLRNGDYELTEEELNDVRAGLIDYYAEHSDELVGDIKDGISYEALSRTLTSVGMGVERVGKITSEILLSAGSIPGPEGPNSFLALNSIGEAGSGVLRTVPKIGRGIATAGKAVPIITTVIDFGTQVHSGESVTNAAIKSAAHTLVATGAAKGGAILGAKIGTIVGGPMGTLVGGVVGTIAGVAVGYAINIAADYYYDQHIGEKVNVFFDKIDNRISEASCNIGDAVRNVFGGIGNAIFE